MYKYVRVCIHKYNEKFYSWAHSLRKVKDEKKKKHQVQKMFKYQAATLLLFSSFDHCCMCSFNILKYCAYQKRLYIENTFFTIRHMHTMALTEHKLLKLLNVKRELGSAERHHTIHCRLTHTHNKKCLTLRLLNKNKMEKSSFC